MERDRGGPRAVQCSVRVIGTRDVESTLTIKVRNGVNPTVTLLLDSGADCSLMKLHVPDPEAPVSLENRVILHGITPDGITSMGSFIMNLGFGSYSYDQEFQLVSSSFPLPYDGILGRDFLKGTGAVLDYGKNSIELFGAISYPMNRGFSQEPKVEEISPREQRLVATRVEALARLVKVGHLTPVESEPLEGLTAKFNDVFLLENDALKFTSVVEHAIDLVPGASPVNIRPYRVAEGHRLEIERQVGSLAAQGLVRRSVSQWNSPLLLVKKRTDEGCEKKWRLCVDYRKVNEITVKVVTPIPRISDILEKLGRSQWYSSLDMASGYWQILIRDKDRCKTAFTAGGNSWEWLRVPFGLTGAPGTFVNMMRQVLDGVANTMTYLDDIIVFTDTLEEHMATLDMVFQRMRAHNLQLQPAKCNLLLSEVTYLGHRITRSGILIDPRNIAVVKEFPLPTTPKMVRSFLGFINYYRGFIKDCAFHALPLTELTRKNVKFTWTPACAKAMEYLKEQIISPQVLHPPDFTQEFMLRTDASNTAMGAILSQGELGLDHPVGFYSAKFNSAQRNYSTIEKEFLAIVRAIENFRVYLLHRKFRLITDHNPLIYIRSSVPQNSRLLRWRLSLEEYDFYIQHQPGTSNATADFLSRLDERDGLTPVPTSEVRNIRVVTRAQQAQINEALSKETVRPSEKVTEEIIDSITGLDPLKYDYDAYVDLVNRVPIINHRVVEKPGKIKQRAKTVVVEFCSRVVLDMIHELNEDEHSDGAPRLVVVNTRKGGKLLLAIRNEKFDRLEYWYVFEAVKLLVQYCHANQVVEVSLDISIPVILPLEYRIVLNMFKFLGLNSDLKIRLYNNIIQPVTEKEVINQILKEFHSGPLGGHQGQRRTLLKIQEKYYWENMARDVNQYVQECELCQKVKRGGITKMPMKITTTASQPWERIAIDVVGPLPVTNGGNRYLLTVQDDLTKFLFAIPVPDQTAETIARALTDNILLFFGASSSVLSDQGSNFMSELFRNTCKFWKSHGVRTTGYHPQTNGGLERSHGVLKDYLSTFVAHDQRDWDEWIKPALFAYNTSVNAATQYTPFKLMFGWDPRIPRGSQRTPEVVYNYSNYLADLKNKLQNAYAVARDNIRRAKEDSKRRYDTRSKVVTYQQDDHVLLSCKETKTGLGKRWQGPYKVLEVPTLENTVIWTGKRKVRVNNNRLKPFREVVVPENVSSGDQPGNLEIDHGESDRSSESE